MKKNEEQVLVYALQLKSMYKELGIVEAVKAIKAAVKEAGKA
jgi:hypothetical protein